LLQACAGITGRLEQVPHGLQEKPFLWIHKRRFAGRDVEKERVELIHTVDESTPLTIGCAGLVLLRVEVRLVIPALPGDFRNTILAVFKVLPELGDALRLRIPSGETNNGDIGFFPLSLVPSPPVREA